MYDQLDFYKELYKSELEFTERLSSRLGYSVTLLTVAGGGYVLLGMELFPLNFFELNFVNILFLVVFTSSLLIFICSIYYFVKTYTGFRYAYFPIAEMSRAIETSKRIGIEEDREEDAKRHIENMLIERYREDAITNRKTNMTKIKYQWKLTISIIATFIALFITFSLWVIFFRSGGV